jgi:hypothetical protein
MLIENTRLSKLKTTFSLEDVVFCECVLGASQLPKAFVSHTLVFVCSSI